MINQKAFHYWTPVVFDELVSLKKPEWKWAGKFLSNLAGCLGIKEVQPAQVEQFLVDLPWRLGSWADQYAYLGRKKIHLTVKSIYPNRRHFKVEKMTKIPMSETALKVSSYFLTLFILPTIASIAKTIFKIYLNRLKAEQKDSTKVIPKKPKELIMEKPKGITFQKPVEANAVIAEALIGKTKVRLLTGSLTNDTAEAIVNAANVWLESGGGVCGAIFRGAGQSVFDECQEILERHQVKSIKTGEAVLTSAGKLASKIKAIVHAAGPIVSFSPDQRDAELLTQAYTNTLKLITAPQNHRDWISSKVVDVPSMRSIAFASISTGIYGYPLDQASSIALKAIKDFIEKNPGALDEVRFVFLPLEEDGQKTANFYTKALKELTIQLEPT
jgi:O-acetyl-ADP-ribose deacetylase (regulator of RNase III)